MASQADFENLLRQMRLEDSKPRKQAENIFNRTRRAQPAQLAQAVLQVARTSDDEHLRQFATVLLRKVIVKGAEGLWLRLPQETQQMIMKHVLAGIESDPFILVRAAFCDIAFDIAQIMAEGTPPKL